MANQALLQRSLREVNKLLSAAQEAAAPPTASSKDMEKALDKSLALFKKAPNDKNYLDLIESMKGYRRAVFEEQYASQYDKPAQGEQERRETASGYGGPDRRAGSKAAASASVVESAYRFWCRTGRMP
jgi:hypothetical protein